MPGIKWPYDEDQRMALAYVCGLVCGDGTVNNTNKSLVVDVQQEDFNMFSYVKHKVNISIQGYTPLPFRQRVKNYVTWFFRDYIKDGYHTIKSQHYRCNSTALFDSVLQYTQSAPHMLKQRIPTIIMDGTEWEKIAYFSGFMFCDGHVEKNGSLRLSQSNYGLLEDVKGLLYDMEMETSICKKSKAKKANICGRICNAKESWYLYIPRRYVQNLIDKGFNPGIRKLQMMRERCRYQ